MENAFLLRIYFSAINLRKIQFWMKKLVLLRNSLYTRKQMTQTVFMTRKTFRFFEKRFSYEKKVSFSQKSSENCICSGFVLNFLPKFNSSGTKANILRLLHYIHQRRNHFSTQRITQSKLCVALLFITSNRSLTIVTQTRLYRGERVFVY